MRLVVRRTHQSDKQTEATEVSAVMSESQNCELSVECGVLGTQAVTVIQLSTGLKSLKKSALLGLSSSQAQPRACVGSMPLRARAKRAVG
jgi:hypothetical protein